MARRVFISYRRQDAKYQARLIYDAFCTALPSQSVFMDIDSIPLGADFVEILEGWVDQCDVLLALIGPGWTEAVDPKTSQRRLDNPKDFVRIEVGQALQRGIPVVPVLLDGTVMPDPDQLPDDIKKLTRRQAEFVEFRTFKADVDRLIDKLNLAKSGSTPPGKPDAEAKQPDTPTKAARGTLKAEATRRQLWSGNLWSRSTFDLRRWSYLQIVAVAVVAGLFVGWAPLGAYGIELSVSEFGRISLLDSTIAIRAVAITALVIGLTCMRGLGRLMVFFCLLYAAQIVMLFPTQVIPGALEMPSPVGSAVSLFNDTMQMLLIWLVVELVLFPKDRLLKDGRMIAFAVAIGAAQGAIQIPLDVYLFPSAMGDVLTYSLQFGATAAMLTYGIRRQQALAIAR